MQQAMHTYTALALLAVLSAAAWAAPPHPHIVYFLVDDLGSANVGFKNDEPITPAIDGLQQAGLTLEHFYSFKFCSPTRSALMSGRLPIHVNQQNHPPASPGGGVPLGMTTLPNILQRSGYATHQIGKWHCGMSTTDRLPVHRGFNSSFGYLSGAEDHNTQKRGEYVDFWRDRAPATSNGTEYATFQYEKEATRIITAHDQSQPLFLYLAFQNVHAPLQVPQRFLDPYAKVDYKPRQMCLGMISAVDEAIGNLTALLKAKGMYEDTLIIFSSDNGGPHDHANNYPLRGSKGSDFEGGTRVVAFLSGGFLPQSRRNQSCSGYMHVCDLYASIGHGLLGQDVADKSAAALGLPPIDSLNMWPMLMGLNATSPRTEIPLSGGPDAAGSGLIVGQYKLVRGKQATSFFPGVHQPNSTHDGSDSAIDCGPGCLFDIQADPVEHHNLNSSLPDVLKRLQARAAELDKTYYQSPGSESPDKAASKAAHDVYHGYWGPWQDNETITVAL